MTEPRTPCAVVGCHRSRKGRWSWIICRDHWRLVPMRVKARYRKAKALCRKRGWITVDKDRRAWWPTERAVCVMDRADRLIIRAANNAARGI